MTDNQRYGQYSGPYWNVPSDDPMVPSPFHSTPQPPAPAPQHSRGDGRRGLLLGFGAALVAALVLTGGAGLLRGSPTTVSGNGSMIGLAPATPGNGSSGSGSGGSGSTTPSQTPTRSGTASATQQIGVVTIVSTLRYQQAQSAGTGMIIAGDGEVLTNNHVIRGATSIVVTVESTGRSYRADVVGTAPASDVAVIQMRGVSGLQTATLADNAAAVRLGDEVIGVGNAGGTGRLTAAAGQVTGLNRSITASDELGQDYEKLSDLIQIDAKIVSGDSGGPLYDAAGQIVGINTAASTARSTTSSAYAIRIDKALEIADKIEQGVETTSIHLGLPGFLGVSSQNSPGGIGASVAGLLEGGPAASAGITKGSTITEVDGRPVKSADDLRAILALRDPGKRITVKWTAPTGESRSATVTLGTGPAD